MVAARWGQGPQALSRSAAGPAPLSFYELQSEAKFPLLPNETKSESELIGNRQEGEDCARGELGPAVGGSCAFEGREAQHTEMWPG